MFSTKFFQIPNLLLPQFPQLLNRHQVCNKSPPSRPRRAVFNLTLRPSNIPRFKTNINFKACDVNENGDYKGGLGVHLDDLLGDDEFQLPVELCMTRALPPALTLGHGVEKLREAIENLKLDPPCSQSGVLRFQVAVPPSVKALDWLCCQQKSLGVYPQFYFLRKEQIHQQFDELGSGSGVCKVSGVGAAVYFHGSLAKGCNLMARYLSNESHRLRAYGFIGIGYDRTSALVEQQPGSFYFLIPQIELNELESVSFVSLTLVWDNSLAYTFGEAVKSLERCLQQIVNYVQPVNMNYRNLEMNYIRGDEKLDAKDVQMMSLMNRYRQMEKNWCAKQ